MTPLPPWLVEAKGGVRLRVRVQPKASRNAVICSEDRVRVALTAAPVDGAANRQLIEVLAHYFDVTKRSVRLAGGDTSRDKAVEIMGLTADDILAALHS